MHQSSQHELAHGAHPSPVAYVLARFPLLSERFVLEEILAVEELGLPVLVFAFRGPDPGQVPTRTARVRAPAAYLPSNALRRIPNALCANAAALLKNPGRYLWALSSCLHDPPTLRAFLGSVSFAASMRRSGVVMLYTHFLSAPAGVVRALSRLLSIPYGVTTHAEDLFLTSSKLLCPRIRDAAILVTISDYNKELMLRRCPSLNEESITVVRSGVAHPTEPPEPRANREPVILSVGRLVPIKGFATLIDAIALLVRQEIGCRCQIVGSGPLEHELRQKVQGLGLQERVQLLGPRDHHEVQRLLRTADVFALPCTRDADGNMDGIPMAIMEAMGMELPVVSTEISGIPELVVPEVGFLVPPDQPEAFAGALARLLNDVGLRRSLGRKARERVMRLHDRSEQARQMYRLLTGREPPER